MSSERCRKDSRWNAEGFSLLPTSIPHFLPTAWVKCWMFLFITYQYPTLSTARMIFCMFLLITYQYPTLSTNSLGDIPNVSYIINWYVFCNACFCSPNDYFHYLTFSYQFLLPKRLNLIFSAPQFLLTKAILLNNFFEYLYLTLSVSLVSDAPGKITERCLVSSCFLPEVA